MTARNPLFAAPKSHLLALEPRVMFDAAAPVAMRAALADAADARLAERSLFAGDGSRHGDVEPARPGEAHGPATHRRGNEARADGPAPTGAGERPTDGSGSIAGGDASHQVIFIDTAVEDYQQLARDWSKQGEVILIDRNADGVAQMEAALVGRTDVSAIHIVSHGEEGALLIGSTRLDAASITGGEARSLAAIGASLAPGGDILVYGCDFAEGADGASALRSLAAATGADVAASTDLTGDAALGGDWVLEARQGDIHARTLSDSAWRHVLDPGPVDAVPIAVAADSLTVTKADKTAAAFTNGYSDNVGTNAIARWTGAATQNGQSYDLVATVVSTDSSTTTVRFKQPTAESSSNKTGDDPTFILVDGSSTSADSGMGAVATIAWKLVLTGTDTVAPADVTFNILDIDGRNGQPDSRESVTADATQLYYYTHEATSDIVFNYDTAANTVDASGTQDENDPVPTDGSLNTKSEASFSYKNTSGFTLAYALAKANTVTLQAQFYMDGNSTFLYTSPVYASIPHLDLDADDSTASGTGAHFTFTEKGAATPVVDSDVRVTNPMAVDSIVSGSVVLTNAKAGDVLMVGTLPSDISARVTTSNGAITVSLSGAGSETDYQAAYRAITYKNTSAAPDTTQRVLAVSFTNDAGYSASATSLIDVTAVDDAPVNTLPSGYAMNEDGGPLALSGISVADPDAGSGVLTVTLSVPTGAGALAAAAAGGVTVVGSGTRSITLNGALSDLNAYLAASGTQPTFTPTADSNGDVTLTMVTNDNGNTGIGGPKTDTDASTITIAPVNDPPVNTLPSGYTMAEDGGPLALSGMSVRDVDSGSGTISVTLSVPAGAGLLSAAGANGVTVSGSGTRTVTLNGTLSAINGYLAASGTQPTFTPTRDFNGSVTLTMSTNDNGNTGAGGPMTDTDTSTITVTPVNDPPVNTLPPGYTVAENGGALALGGISVSDVDAGSGTLTMTLSVPDGAGVLAGASAGGVTVSGSGTRSLTLNGTLSALNGYLAASGTRPTFTAATDYTGAVTLTLVTDDNGNTGAGGPMTDTDASTITVTRANHPPTSVGALPDRSAQDAQSVSYATAAGFTDADGDGLAYTAAGLPAGLSIDRNSGVISGVVDRSASQTGGGVYAVTVTATDPSNTSAAQTFRIAVTNPPPTARPDQASTAAGAPVTVAVLANDTDPDGDPLAVTAVGTPTHGAATRNADGTVTYTPTAGYSGSDSFTYGISDGQGGVSSSTVTITVSPPADIPPTARADAASTAAGAPVIVAVLANDTDPDGDPLTVASVAPPAHGTAALNPDGTITYTPTAGFTGVDTFAYTVSDGRGGSAGSTVKITVAAPADAPPTARPDQASTAAGSPVTVAVLANDTDPDGDPLTVTAAGPASHGAVAINPDGTITYTPGAGFTGADAFAYTVSDGRGGVASSTVTVTVAPPADGAPTARPDQATTPMGTPVVVAVLANDTDPDGDPLSVAGAGPAAHGAVVANPDGTVTYTPAGGFTGADAFTYTASDGRGGVSSSTVSVTVTPPADRPPAAAPDTASTAAGTPVTVAVLANDSDPDGDPLTVTAVGPAAHGTVAANPVGTVTYTPAAGFTGADAFTYTVSDGRGGVSTSTVSVTVTPPADRPPAAAPDIASTAAGTPVTVAVLANDSDPDGDPLTVTAAGPAAHGAVVVNPDGTVTYTPSTGFTGPDTFTYTVSDGRGGVSTSTVSVTVTPPADHLPAATPDTASTPAGTPVVVAVLANDSDPDGDPLTVTAVGPAVHGAVVVNPDGTVTYTPSSGFTGSDTFTYTVSDGRGGASTATVSVAVEATAAGPTALPVQAATTTGAPVLVAVLAGDSAPDGGPLTVVAVGPAAHGVVTANPDGTVSYTPAPGYTGTDGFTYTIADDRGETASAAVSVAVTRPQDSTEPRADRASTYVDTPVRLAGPAAAAGDPSRITSLSAVNGAVTADPDGTLTYTPRRDFTGFDTVTFAVRNGAGEVSTYAILVRVSPRTADVEELLAFGRVRPPGPAPASALARAVSADLDGGPAERAPWLPVVEAVETARTLNATGIGRRPVGDAVERVRTLEGTSIDARAPVAGEVRRLREHAVLRDAGDRAFDPRWSDVRPKPLAGFSCAAAGDGQVMFQSVVRGGAIYLDAADTSAGARAPIAEFAVTAADGGPRPDWIKVDPRGLAILERPADADEVRLVLWVRRSDGAVVRTPVVIQGATGVIEPDLAARDVLVPAPPSTTPSAPGRLAAPQRHARTRAAPLDATLATPAAGRTQEAAALWRNFR